MFLSQRYSSNPSIIFSCNYVQMLCFLWSCQSMAKTFHNNLISYLSARHAWNGAQFYLVDYSHAIYRLLSLQGVKVTANRTSFCCFTSKAFNWWNCASLVWSRHWKCDAFVINVSTDHNRLSKVLLQNKSRLLLKVKAISGCYFVFKAGPWREQAKVEHRQ